MSKVKRRKSVPKSVFLCVPDGEGGYLIAPMEFSGPHADNLLSMPNNGGWVEWDGKEKQDADNPSGDSQSTTGADTE